VITELMQTFVVGEVQDKLPWRINRVRRSLAFEGTKHQYNSSLTHFGAGAEEPGPRQGHTAGQHHLGPDQGGGRVDAEQQHDHGPALNGRDEIIYVPDAHPLTDDQPLGPAPDPKLFVTYDGSMGKGKPGTGAGAHAQGMANVVNKIKGALD
jgi:hypothetical protein